jgi:hypothetical protein
MQLGAASLRMVLLFMIAFAAACATVRNPALDQARDVYDKLAKIQPSYAMPAWR